MTGLFDGSAVFFYIKTSEEGEPPAFETLGHQRDLTFEDRVDGVKLQVDVLLDYGDPTQAMVLDAYARQTEIEVAYVEPREVTGREHDLVTEARVTPTLIRYCFPDDGVSTFEVEAAGVLTEKREKSLPTLAELVR